MLIEIVIENEFCPFSSTANLHYEKFSDGTIKCLKDEIPFEVPAGWIWCRLKNISTTNIGLNYHPEDINDQGVAVLRSNNIKDNVIDYSDLVKVNCAIKDNQYLNNHDILICSRNGSKNLVGKCAVYEGDPERFSFGAFMAVLRTSLYEYVYYYLLTNVFRKLFHSDDSKQINQVTQTILKEALIPLPPFQEQSRISSAIKSLFSYVDSFDANKKELTEIVSQTRSKILDLAIRGKLVPQDSDDEPATVLLERIRRKKEELIKAGKLKRDKRESVIFRGEDNSYYEKLMGSSIEKQIKIPFDLPNGWVWVRGRDCFSGMTNTIPTGIDFDYIDIDSIDNREHKITKPKHLNVSDAPSRAKRAVYTGSVLFSLVRPYLQNIARVSEKHKDCIASTGFYVCNSNGVLSSEYLFYLMISPYVVNGLNQFMKGDNSPSINKDDIENWLYPIPPLKEQKRITYQIEKLLTQITKIASALK